VVGRVGGDEFAMILESLGDIGAIVPLTEKIQKSIRQPMAHHAHSLEAGASIGIAVYPTRGVTRDELMRVADAAMYHAKRAGKNSIHWAEIGKE
jgi:diguanylate cyclase (GGDEF)-like protein